MHGIIGMSRELKDMIPPDSKAMSTLSIISGSRTTHPPQWKDPTHCFPRTDCAEHLLSLVNDIVDFGRFESNRLELEETPFSVVAETIKVVNMLRFLAGKALALCLPAIQSHPYIQALTPPHPNKTKQNKTKEQKYLEVETNINVAHQQRIGDPTRFVPIIPAPRDLEILR